MALCQDVPDLSPCCLSIIHVCCQDVSSFGNTLSRCPIFRQHPVKMSHLSATPCQDVPSFGRFLLFIRNYSCVLSRCPIFRQHPVKMSHLSAGSYCLYVIHVCCQDVPSFGNTLSRCPIFRQVHTVRRNYSCVLSRCPIFRQHPVKMSHLSAGSYCLYVIIHVCCQEVPSFGNILSRYPIFRQVHTVCT